MADQPRAAWRVIRHVGILILSGLLVVGVAFAAYAGGVFAVLWCLLLWAALIFFSTSQDRQLTIARRLGYRDGYRQGWRDNTDQKEYEPWPM